MREPRDFGAFILDVSMTCMGPISRSTGPGFRKIQAIAMSPLTIRFERMKDVYKTLKWGFTRLDFLENTMNGALDFAVLPPHSHVVRGRRVQVTTTIIKIIMADDRPFLT